MANTLTNLIPDLYEALDLVAREMTGMIPSVTIDTGAERAAKGQSIIVPISPAADAEDITAGTNPPDTGDQTFENASISITKARAVPFRWTGEEQKGIGHGPGYSVLRRDQIAQAIRTLVNEVEADLAALYPNASRAYGTAGTTPFGGTTGLEDPAYVRQILTDNGAPLSDLQMVVNTAGGAKLRTLSSMTDASKAGTDELRAQGILLPLHGFDIRESAQIKLHTKGTGASYQTNLSAGYVAGAKTIAADTGTGTILAGDVVNFADDSPDYSYVVKTALADGSFVLQNPGLMSAVSDNKAISLAANYRANLAFHRSALALVTRAPALPEEGDAADDRMIVTDPRTGLSFEVCVYRQYKRVRYEIGLAWGVACIKPEFMALLLG
jgi:hypothetical protein